jgi:hypothetical protein
MLACLKEIYAAKAIVHGRRLGDLPPADLAALRTSITATQGKVEYTKMINEFIGEDWDAILSGHYRNDIAGAGK